jgi:branched-chain amino acid transport system ATP-binding protein
MMTILELDQVSKRFGAVVTADRIDLKVASGEAVGILGPNGAGKSTLFNLIAGVLRPDAGTIRLKGRNITRLPSRERCRDGIGRSFQIPRPFESLTTFENVVTAAAFGRPSSERDAAGIAADVLNGTGLLKRANVPAGRLTLIERKRLELARALATGPELLLLDEIAGGLTEAECHGLVALIRSLNEQGVTILWIEHVVHALLSVVSRLVVLEFGRTIAEGEPRAVLASPEVRRSYLGLEAV